jgi:hypothetical protein
MTHPLTDEEFKKNRMMWMVIWADALKQHPKVMKDAVLSSLAGGIHAFAVSCAECPPPDEETFKKALHGSAEADEPKEEQK